MSAPKPAPKPAQYGDQFVLRELLGAVEEHVFEEVRAAVLRVVLQDRPGIDRQAHLDPATRVVVVADEIPQAVVEFTDEDRRIGLGDRRQSCDVGFRDRRRTLDRDGKRRARRRRGRIRGRARRSPLW